MVATTSFLTFGLLGGFAYLAYTKKRELLAYGLGAVGVAFFLDGVRLMVGEGKAFATFLDILHHVTLGVGGAFLAYVAAVDGWKFYRIWKEKRHEAEVAFQAKLAAARQNAAAETDPESRRLSTPGNAKRSGAT